MRPGVIKFPSSNNCSSAARHVFMTCLDCTMTWNCFLRMPFACGAVFPFFSQAVTACRRQTMQIFTRCAAAMVLIAAGLLLVPAANAEVQSPSPGATDQPSNIPDQKIDAAAAAIQQVASVKQDYKQRIAAAAPADKERILNEGDRRPREGRYRPGSVGRGIRFDFESGAERSQGSRKNSSTPARSGRLALSSIASRIRCPDRAAHAAAPLDRLRSIRPDLVRLPTATTLAGRRT